MSLTVESRRDGQIERIVLDRPKANVLDEAMIAALRTHLAGLDRPQLKLITIEGAGRHFSFGASVEEHLPGAVDRMLPSFHRLFVELEDLGVPTAAIVRGQCLGGGCEVALWAGRVFADPTAHLGVPEVKLGVFPPVAAAGLRWRVGGARATELILTGRTLDAATALSWGLVDAVDDDPAAALDAWFDATLAPLSAAAARHAWRAARRPLARALAEELPALEAHYLGDLMQTADAVEGIRAFVERRPAVWSHA